MSSSASAMDPMDVTSSPTTPVPSQSGDAEANGKQSSMASYSSGSDQNAAGSASSTSMPAPASTSSSTVHQPKIVQTAFIHKLYNMLEDSSIQHLISWSANAESFVMSPTADFSKVLSQYFKHTNISSFVRQLNMYGFHKERDVFHTGNPDTTLWEFKHGNGSFKRGDIAGLRDIKRRASRHALVHRETNFLKPSSSQPGTPVESIPVPPDTVESRLLYLEHTLYDMGNRLQRSEEHAHHMLVRHQAAIENMGRLLHFNQELSRALLALAPPDSVVHRDVMNLQGEMQRQAEAGRSAEEPHEVPYGGRQPYYGNVDNVPVSPRQLAQDDPRRHGGGVVTPTQARGPPHYRPTVPSALSAGPRRPYGSIGGTTQSSPLRNAAAPPSTGPHPLSNVETTTSSGANLARRHTAADIRAHGWQPGPSPYAAAPAAPAAASAPWPSPPGPGPGPGRGAPEDQRIRESLSTYSLQTASHSHPQSRPTTPPPHAPAHESSSSGPDTFGSWSWNTAGGRDTKGPLFKDSSAPATRRGSMAHILNPSDTAERSDEDDDRGDDDRKRKRMQR